MNTIITQHLFRVDLDNCPLEATLPRPLSHTDELADEIVLAVRRGMTPTSLAGMSVLASLTNANRQTLPLAGRIVGNNAVVTLPADCYAVPGPFRLTVQLRSGNIRHTLLHLTGELTRTSSDQLIASGDLLPTLPELLEDIADMHAATEAAQNAVDAVDEAIVRANESIGAALGDVAKALGEIGPAIVCSASGDTTSIRDAAARNALSAVSAITPVQSGSGNPSPDNVRPISGWDTAALMHAGRNLARYPYQDTTMTHNGITFTDNGDGTITANGTATDEATFYLSSRIQPLRLKKGCTYTISGAPGVMGAHLYLQDTSFKQTVSDPLNVSKTITAEYDDYYMFLRVEAGITLDNAVFRPMLVMGGTALEFEPYKGQMLSANLPETVYGGTLDWTTGTLTVAHKGVRLTGEEDWTELTTGMPDGQHAYQWRPADYATGKLSGLCSHYTVNRGSYRIVNVIYFGNRITVNTVQETVADFKAWLAAQVEANTPVTVVYELAAPYTIQLTPQQLQLLGGNNALWSTSGSTSLAYIADTKLYIDNTIAALAANQLNA